MKSIYIWYTFFRDYSNGAEGAKKLAQGLKALINLKILTIDLE